MAAHCVQLKIHPVKINILSIDLKNKGMCLLNKTILFIQSDGAGIVAAPGVLHIFTPGA